MERPFMDLLSMEWKHKQALQNAKFQICSSKVMASPDIPVSQVSSGGRPTFSTKLNVSQG
jgi:hypothetical protein